MNFLFNTFTDIYRWAYKDYSEWPLRFVIEILAWIVSIGCAITMALTVPNPPLIFMYPVWISGCAMYCWAAWTRRSTGMIANYLLLIIIDSIGLVRMIIN